MAIGPLERDGFWYFDLGLDPADVAAFNAQSELGKAGFNPGTMRRAANRAVENPELEYVDLMGRYISSDLAGRIRNQYNDFVNKRRKTDEDYLKYKAASEAQPGRQSTIITPLDNKVAGAVVGMQLPVTGSVI